jgi:hypothetical protein
MLCICPAGMDCAADGEDTFDSVLVAIEPGQLSLSAAEDSLELQLTGYLGPGRADRNLRLQRRT